MAHAPASSPVTRWLACAVLVTVLLLTTGPAGARVIKSSTAGFSLEHELVLPVSPGEAFDAMTGDISGWWDHSFSGTPKALYIEPRPGGGFYEIFDDSGDGALHASVTYADRGRLLRFVGPLGLAGNAFTMSVTVTYEPHADGTLVKLSVNSMGIMEDGWDEAVDQVWHHFLFERLKPYVEAGKHRGGSRTKD
ncbi:MAG: SRPBCC domain-containing protein [Candidatus Krumholzibacteria bacterium]|nr:SRPBCC domain-containing protein [Candidatus Krumholzibacteria bacterium]